MLINECIELQHMYDSSIIPSRNHTSPGLGRVIGIAERFRECLGLGADQSINECIELPYLGIEEDQLQLLVSTNPPVAVRSFQCSGFRVSHPGFLCLRDACSCSSVDWEEEDIHSWGTWLALRFPESHHRWHHIEHPACVPRNRRSCDHSCSCKFISLFLFDSVNRRKLRH